MYQWSWGWLCVWFFGYLLGKAIEVLCAPHPWFSWGLDPVRFRWGKLTIEWWY